MAVSLLPLIAALFAVPQFLPQLARLRRTGDAAGVSWAWAALTSVNNAAWTAYFALSRLWTALAPSISATLLAGILAVWLVRRGELARRAALGITGWAALLAVAGGVFGRAVLGTALTALFIVQTAPSVWKAYRSERVSGISAGTWLLILGELLCWGIYGTDEMDPRLMVLGWAGVAISLLILARVAVQVRSHQRDTALVMITDEDVRRLLAESWGLFDGTGIARHDGGMGSRTWRRSAGCERELRCQRLELRRARAAAVRRGIRRHVPGRLPAAPLIDAYRAAGPLTEAQLAEGLPVLLRFRWAVQADYFAWRITENDLTGIAGPEENEKGLEDARRALLGSD